MREHAAIDVDAPTTQVVESALRDMKELVRLEIDLAKDDFRRDVLAARRSIFALVASLLLAASAISLLLVALVLATSAGALATLGATLLLFIGAASACLVALKTWPRALLGDTERRIEKDIDQLKEHL